MIHVIATIEVAPGKRDEFLGIFNANVPNVKAEDGCLAYGPAVDTDSGIPAQPPLRDNAVVVIEQWESLGHLKAHLAAAHMQTYRQAVQDLVQGAEIQVLRPA